MIALLVSLAVALPAMAQPPPHQRGTPAGVMDIHPKPTGPAVLAPGMSRTVRGRSVKYKLCPTCAQVDATLDSPLDKALAEALSGAVYEKALADYRRQLDAWMKELGDSLYNAAARASGGTYRDSAGVDLEDAILERTRFLCSHLGLSAECKR